MFIIVLTFQLMEILAKLWSLKLNWLFSMLWIPLFFCHLWVAMLLDLLIFFFVASKFLFPFSTTTLIDVPRNTVILYLFIPMLDSWRGRNHTHFTLTDGLFKTLGSTSKPQIEEKKKAQKSWSILKGKNFLFELGIFM